MNLSAKIAYNSLIQIAGKFVSTILGLAAVALVTRYLGQVGFGEYTTVVTFLSFFGIIADFGLTLVTAQMIAKPEADEEAILGNLFTFRLVSALIFIGLGPLLVFFFPYSQAVKIGVIAAAPSFIFNALNQVMVGLFQKKLRMDKSSIAEVASRAILLGLTVFFIRKNFGLLGILAATTLAGAVSFAFHWFFSKNFTKIKLAFDKKVWQEIFQKAWPLSITIVFNLVYLKSDTLILSLLKTPEEVGLYGAAYKVIDVLVTIPFMFAGIILPILTAAWAAGNRKKFKSIAQKSFDALAVLAVPMAVGTQFLGARIMALVAGPEFCQSGPILAILVAAAASIFLGSITAHGIIAIDEQKKIIPAYVFTSLTALAGYLIFIPAYSYFGAAWVTVYSETVIALASAWFIWKKTGFFPKLETLAKAAAASGLMAGALHFAAASNLLFLLALSTIVYFAALLALRGFSFITLKDLF